LGDDYEESPARLAVVAADFADAAVLAEEAGASIIELNLSCPNSIDPRYGDVKPPLCSNVEMTTRVVEAVRERLRGRTQLVAKLSYLDKDVLARLVHGIAPFIDGIAGINTIQSTVRRVDDTPTFPGRSRAGVSGIAVRDHARDFVARLAGLRIETGKYFEIVGMGGVTDPESFRDLYELGASAVQTASGAFANPFLAAECISDLGESLPDAPPIGDPQLVTSLRNVITGALGKAVHVSRTEVAGRLPLRPAQTFSLLDTMAREGELEPVADSPGFYRLAAYGG
jgi:dihydroorotate dehydrogenase